MSPRHLPNHLRKHRKRAGISQADIAWLLGGKNGAKGSRVSRYERFRRSPDLHTALGLEVILGAPIKDLFKGLFHEIRSRIAGRAGELHKRLAEKGPAKAMSARLQVLQSLSQSNTPAPQPDEPPLPSTTDSDPGD